jgi:MraZ protein
LNTYKKESRAFIRTILGWADDVTLDGQGRMALSKRLMDFAGISEKVLIIGTLERIELWDPETFNRQETDQTIEYEQLAELVMGGDTNDHPQLLE